MYRIKLSDGTTEYPARWCSARGGLLTMCILSAEQLVSIAEAFTNNTGTVTFIYDSTEETFEGFTRLIVINGSTPGEYTITLTEAV